MEKKKDFGPLYFSAAAICLFYILFTHLIIKTDDGHFLGILNESGFELTEWLRERYATVSGRTVSEFLMMSFLKIHPIFWKIFSSAAFVFLLWLLWKFSTAFTGEFSQKQKNIFCACVPFLVFTGAANPGAFWFAGSFTYLLPFTAFAAVVAPPALDLLGVEYKKIPLTVLSVASAPLACSQEQTAALTLAFYLVLSAALVAERSARLRHFIPLPLCVVTAFFLFSSPGMGGRLAMETGSFARFAQMNLAEKILCGFSNYFGYAFFMSLPAMGIFVALAALAMREAYNNRKIKAFASFVFFFWAFTAVIWNVAFIAVNRATPDAVFQREFIKGEFSAFAIVTVVLCFVLLVLVGALCFLLAVKERRQGFFALLCLAAGVCSGVVMGFSSSVYASGQRVFFFSDMLLLFGSSVLFSSVRLSRRSRAVLTFAVFAAITVFGLKCINYAFLEVPVMG